MTFSKNSLSYHEGGKVPGGPQSEQLALLQGGEEVLPRMDTVKQSVHQSHTDAMGTVKQSVQEWFGSTADMIEKTKNRLTRWTDEDIRKETSTGGFWQVWYDRMVGTSILPESKEGVQGWFGDMKDGAEDLKDRLFDWIGDNSFVRRSPNWEVYRTTIELFPIYHDIQSLFLKYLSNPMQSLQPLFDLPINHLILQISMNQNLPCQYQH